MDNEENSSTIVTINSDDDEEVSINSDKPIIQLFRRLITSDSKQNTVLTNAQIVDILQKELKVNLSELHELESDIYLTIMKKYLKDWPQWDEFDRVINKLKRDKNNSEMKIILESKYINLKKYLKTMLDVAQNLAKPTIQKVRDEKIGIAKENDKDAVPESSVVLEIHASRNQLNQLFFQQPNPELNNTVFNPTYLLPTQIQLSTLPIEAILNWWGVNISMITSTNIPVYKREMHHELKHILVNKKLMAHFNPCNVLDQDIKVGSSQCLQKINITEFINYVDTMAECRNNFEIYNFIKKDLKLLNYLIPLRTLCKRYTNKYPYVRYLYKETDSNGEELSKKYDLQLEETLSPCYHIYIGQTQDMNTTLSVYCAPCSMRFTGSNLVEELKAHFNEQHLNEPDWKCMNCNKTFPMVTLARNWWTHRC